MEDERYPLAGALVDDDDARVVDVIDPEPVVSIARTTTTPMMGKIKIHFEDGDGIANFAELVAILARRGKPVELTIKVLDE